VKRLRPVTELEASYVCGACGEEIVVPVDLAAGEDQEYVEDCPVCCRPNVLRVSVDSSGHVSVQAELE
jgi:DNA replicative helicase MCM subunit Mcm2 (Cdc46/Mcm family)